MALVLIPQYLQDLKQHKNSSSPGTHKVGITRWFVVFHIPPKLGDAKPIVSPILGVQLNMSVILKEQDLEKKKRYK